MKPVLALSDYLPNALASRNRSGWLPSEYDERNSELARASHNDSYHGESLLYASRARVLVHIGYGAAERAFNFSLSAENACAIIVSHRDEDHSIISSILKQDCHPNIRGLDSIRALKSSLIELGISEKDTIAVYIDQNFFSIDLISSISSIATIDLIIGGFRETSWPTFEVYQSLKKHARAFRLLSAEQQTIIQWDRQQEIDVSVVMPAYNIEAYLPQSLDSVCDISEINCEILVVDDGSKDGTADVVRSYSKRFPHIKLISQENGGCAAARQRGLEEARGTYVGFLDGDDWVTPGMFEKLFRRAIETNADIAMCGYTEEYTASGKSAPIQENFQSSKKIFHDCWEVNPDEIILNPPTLWRKLFRRSFLTLNNINFNISIKRFDDLLFNGEALLLRPRIIATSGNYYHYRLERPGQTVGFKDRRLFVHFEIFDSLWERVSTIGREYAEILFKQIQIGTHFWVDTLFDDENLRQEYRQLAGKDIFDKTEILNSQDIINLAKQLSPEKEFFVRSIKKK